MNKNKDTIKLDGFKEFPKLKKGTKFTIAEPPIKGFFKRIYFLLFPTKKPQYFTSVYIDGEHICGEKYDEGY